MADINDKFFTFLRAADEYCISRNGGNVPYLADNDAFSAEETPANHQYNMLRSIGWINSVFVTIQNDKNLYTCTKEILKYRIAGMQMIEIQIGRMLCSPEALKTPLKNQVRQNVQPSTGRGIAKFR